MKDAIVEAVIGKDILQSRQVARPALFRQAFEILCAYPAQEISYTKLLGQLQNKGNTEGQTLSDVAQTDVAATQTWDTFEIAEYADGKLPTPLQTPR